MDYRDDHCAWGVTAMNADTNSLFEERVNPDNPDQYAFKGEWLDFHKWTETIAIKDADPIEYEIRSTRHGPIQASFSTGKSDSPSSPSRIASSLRPRPAYAIPSELCTRWSSGRLSASASNRRRAESDAIRDELTSMGWEVRDTADGVKLKRVHG